MNRLLVACFPVSVVLAAFSTACAHPQSVTITSAAAELPPKASDAPAEAPSKDAARGGEAPPVAVAPGSVAPGPVAPGSGTKDDGVAEGATASSGDAVAKDTSAGEMSFEQLSAALGDGKIALAIDHSDAPASKGIDPNGYAAAGVVHQAAADGVKRVGELQVSGGITAASVRGVVHENAARLRTCYERGLQADPTLAGRVIVSFAVDAQGGVGGVESQSDTLPASVTSCVATVFTGVTFAPPKTAPAKIVVPVDFNKDS